MHEIVRYDRLEAFPPEAVEAYLKFLCKHLVNSVVDKILFGNYKDVASALSQEEDDVIKK